MFGQNRQTGFGGFGSTTTPFGGGTGFGTTNQMFGQNPTSQGSSLFGNTAPSSSGTLFGGGTSAFGNTPSNTSSFGFGQAQNNTQTGGSLFGTGNTSSLFSPPTTNSAFGQRTTGFGTTNTSSLFGSTTTSSIFGGQSNNTSLFGQAGSSGSSLFGSKPLGSAFGSSVQPTLGTTVKFVPTNGTDTMMKGGANTTISTKHQCITAMKEYENKSLEELRSEDYQANRKGPQQPSLFGGGTGAFGATQQQQPQQTSAFSLFGNNTQQQNKPAFGGFGTNTSNTTSSLFGTGQQQQPQQPIGGSIFGNQNKPSLFGSTATTTASSTGFSFGQPQQTSSIFGQNKPLFGTATTTQSGGLFGSSSTANSGLGTSTTGFGTGSSLFGQTNQTGGGLFGVNKPTVGFGQATTSNTGFGFGQTTQASGGLFGNKPAGTTGFSFGQPTNTGGFGTGTGLGATSTSFGTGNSLFGQNTQTGGGLFGANKPVGFGQPTTSNTGFGFGQTTQTSGGLFGNKPAGTTGFSFGQPTNTGGFGSMLGGTSSLGTGTSGAFNLGGMSTMGAVPGPSQQVNNTQAEIQQQLLALAMSPYGDNPLFQNLRQSSLRKEELTMPTNPAAQRAVLSPKYKVSLRPKSKIKAIPIQKVDPSKVQLFDGLDEEDAATFGDDTFQPRRRSVKKLMIGANASLNRSQVAADLPTEPKIEPLFYSAAHTPDVRADEAANGSTLRPLDNRKSPGSLGAAAAVSPAHESTQISPASTVTSPGLRSPLSEPFDVSIVDLGGHRVLVDQDNGLDHDQATDNSDVFAHPHPCGIVLRRPGYYTMPSMDELAELADEEGDCLVENFVVGREGYGNVMFPGVVNVKGLNLDEIIEFQHKEINIYPDDDSKPEVGEGLNRAAQVTLDHVWPVDKSTRLAIKDYQRLMDMDYRGKLERATAKLGAEFLNYRAETGSWVFQVQHFSKYRVPEDVDEDEQLLQQQQQQQQQQQIAVKQPPVKKIADEPGTKVLSSQPMALSPSPAKKLGFEEDTYNIEKELIMDLGEDEDTMDLTKTRFPHLDNVFAKDKRQCLFMNDDDDEFMKEDTEESIMKTASKKAPGTVLSTRPSEILLSQDIDSPLLDQTTRTQGLKLWGSTGVKGYSTATPPQGARKLAMGPVGPLTHLGESIRKISPIKSVPGYHEPATIYSGLPQVSRKTLVGVRCKVKAPPALRDSILNRKERSLSDMGFFHSRSFRAGWGALHTFAHLGKPLQEEEDVTTDEEHFSILPQPGRKSLSKRLPRSAFVVLLETVNPTPWLATVDDMVQKVLTSCLEVVLVHSRTTQQDAPCPRFTSNQGLDCLHDYVDHTLPLCDKLSSIAHPDAAFCTNLQTVWGLLAALWGRLHSPLLAEEGEVVEEGKEYDKGGYAKRVLRRDALSKWLARSVAPTVKEEMDSHSKEFKWDVYNRILEHLSGFQLLEACKAALEKQQYNVAMLIAQAGGSPALRRFLTRQLDIWRQLKTDQFIDLPVLTVYTMLAGHVTWQTSKEVINVCKGLDWKRCLGVHCWYACPPTASVQDILESYGQYALVKEPTSAPPLPAYLEADLSRLYSSRVSGQIQDVVYQVLSLYTDRSKPLHTLLDPSSHTKEPMDFRLSWLLCEALRSLDYTHLSADHYTSLCHSFASQLQTIGLWQWAIFVLMHLPEPKEREYFVREVLYHHVMSTGKEDLNQRERFVHEQLQVPVEWIHHAKAVLARTQNKHYTEAYHLLKAKKWREAHDIILQHIAAKCIINEQHDYLRGLLVDIARYGCTSIPRWDSEGKVYLDYINMAQAVETLKKGEPGYYELEKLQPEVSTLCMRVANLPCPTCAHNVARAEMAKTVANLMRTLLTMKDPQQFVSGQLIPVVTALPLPEDYALEELQQLTHSYLLELTTS